MVKKLLEVFGKNNCRKLLKKKFRIEKVLKRKGDKLNVKWRGYDNCFNSCIDKIVLEGNLIIEISEMEFFKLNF